MRGSRISLRSSGLRFRMRLSGLRRGSDKMKRYKIQKLTSLEREMRAVARGARPAPADAALPSFNSVEALVRLLTPENRQLLALIRDRKPRSVTELVRLTGRSQPN